MTLFSFLLDNINTTLYRQIVDILIGTNRAPLVAELSELQARD